jgi:signal transduction histidine kinase
LYGHVLISRAENPDLIDMSNRQGLVENVAYEDFLAHVRAEFRHFEQIVFQEYVQPSWQQPVERFEKAAQRAHGYGTAMIRALVHAIRQPVAGMGFEAARLRRVARDETVSPEIRRRLLEIHERLRVHLDDIDSAVEEVLTFDPEEAVEVFDVRQAVREALSKIEGLARTLRIRTEAQLGRSRRTVVMPRPLLVEVVTELLRNGLQANRPDDRVGFVSVEVGSQGRYIEVLVRDNGTGIRPEDQEGLFYRPMSTKGRPGVGLMSTRELLALFRSTVELLESSNEGTAFAIRIPSESELKKEIA